jgi:hypothetical protein
LWTEIDLIPETSECCRVKSPHSSQFSILTFLGYLKVIYFIIKIVQNLFSIKFSLSRLTEIHYSVVETLGRVHLVTEFIQGL